MIIRGIRKSDRRRCTEIFERAWNEAFPTTKRSITADQLDAETEGETVFVAERDGTVVGFASVFEPASFLHHLYVDPDYQRHGAGAKLLAYAERIVDDNLTLKCQIANEGAMRFYAEHGYEESGERGEDAVGEWVRLASE